MTWKIKTTEDGKPVIADTKVTYLSPEGEELALDPPSMYAKILDLNKEAKKHRERADELATKYAPLKDVQDVNQFFTDAQTAMSTVANFNDKDWMKAEKVDALKADINKAWEGKLQQKDVQIQEITKAHSQVLYQKDAKIRRLLVSNNFAQSPWFVGEKKKTTLRPDLAESFFGDFFKVEEDKDELKVVAYYDKAGKDMILSKNNPGEPAPFEEAIGLLIDRYPGKNEILVTSGGGSGGGGGQGGNVEENSIAGLEAQIAEAQKNGDAKSMITLKNRLFALRKSQQRTA